MSEKRHALSIAEVAREMLGVYRRHWTFLVPAAVVILLPQAIIDGFFDGFRVAGVDSVKDVAILAGIPLTAAVGLLGEAVYAGLAAAAVVEWRAGHPVPSLPALVRSLPLRTLVAIDVILSVGAAVGFVFLVLPGLVLLTYFGIAPAVAKIERLPVWQSLRRSALLVQGQFWHVLTIVAGLMVFTDLAMQAVTFPFHGHALIATINLMVEALLEPFQGLAIVIVTLRLMELRGQLPAADEISTALAGNRHETGRPPRAARE